MANSKKKCKGCGEYYRRSENDPEYKKWCSEKCKEEIAINHVKTQRAAKRVALAKKLHLSREPKSKESRELNRKSLEWQHNKTQEAFNKLRVLQEKIWFYDRGLQPTCISCDKPNMDWCCGHYTARGATKSVAYDPVNTWLQCNNYCNRQLSANKSGTPTSRGYEQGLRDRFGDNYGNAIIDYCKTNFEVVNWTCDQLETMRKEFSAEYRQLSKEYEFAL